MSITATQLMVRIGADTAGAEAGINGVARMLANGSPLMLGIGALAAAGVGIGVAATKMAGDFQAGMVSIVTGAGESQSNLKLISDGVLQLAKDTGTSTKQLTDGLYMIESGGYRGQKALDILKNAAEGAKVGAADLGTVADATDTILKNFGESGMTSAQAVNTLIATVANGKTHMEDLASSLSGVLPTAAAVGVSLDDVMAAMATMTGEGVDAANASTYLRQTLLALTAPAPKAVAALKDVGLSTQQVSDAMKKSLPGALELITEAVGKKFPVGSAAYVAALKDIAGGSKQIQGMLDLTGQHMATFKNDVDLIGGAAKKGGSAINGWALVQSTFNQKMDQAKEVVQTLFIQLGTHLLPVATQLAGMFADELPGALDKASSFVAKNVTPTLTLLSAWFTKDGLPLLKAFGAFVMGTVVPALAQLVAWAAVHVLPILGELGRVFVQNILPALQQVATAVLTKLVPSLERLWEKVSPILIPVFRLLGWVLQTVVGPSLSVTIDVVSKLIDALSWLIGKIGDLLGWLGQLKDGLGDALKNVPGLGGLLSGQGISLPHFAAGGLMGATGWALVGEQGPELVKLPGGSRVYSHPDSTRLANAPGAGSGASANGDTGPMLQPIILQVDGKTFARAVVPHIPGIVAQATGTRHL